MNDFAKFIFCFSGFVGFTLFFLLGFAFHRDFFVSLFLGSCGCITFALSGRLLLGFVLNGVHQNSLNAEFSNQSKKIDPVAESTKQVENSSVVNEAVTQSKLFVEEKA